MKFDRIQINIINKIKQEVKEEYGVSVDESDVSDILDGICRSTIKGMRNERKVRLPFFGTFNIKPVRRFFVEQTADERKEFKAKGLKEQIEIIEDYKAKDRMRKVTFKK